MEFRISRTVPPARKQPQHPGFVREERFSDEEEAIEHAKKSQAWADRGWCTCVWAGVPREDGANLVARAYFVGDFQVRVKRFPDWVTHTGDENPLIV
jgi:hypothetical protein